MPGKRTRTQERIALAVVPVADRVDLFGHGEPPIFKSYGKFLVGVDTLRAFSRSAIIILEYSIRRVCTSYHCAPWLTQSPHFGRDKISTFESTDLRSMAHDSENEVTKIGETSFTFVNR